MNLQSRLEISPRNPYPFDAETDRLGVYADETFPYRMVASNNALWYLEKARQSAQEFSASYRNFRVGVSVIAFDTKSMNCALFNGANVKVDATNLINVHAEDTAVGKAEDKGYDLISFIGVVGDIQDDQHSGRHISTLHPCGRCRNKYQDSTLINEKTLFKSANMDFTVLEMYTLNSLIQFHEGVDNSSITTVITQPEFANWDDVVLPHLFNYASTLIQDMNS